jgi:3-phenylpropionate/trans-cinnamate dioxygenase ferredoxin subunit
MKVVVAAARSFAPGSRCIVRVGGRSIGVFHVGDRFYAVRNRCPHQGGPLCQGRVLHPVVSQAPGDARIRESTPTIACPWHGWEYDLETGQSFIGVSEAGVRSYEVTVEPGTSLTAELEAGRDRDRDERVPGPYVAETFEVFVEDDYVVLET